MGDKTTISIDKEIRDELKLIGAKGEDYESIIKRNITFTKKFDNEKDFHDWVFFNYNLLGFDRIITENRVRFPDFIMLKDGKEVRVEVETLSSNFILHKHNPKEVDLVICLVKNKELPVKVVEISPFEFSGRIVSNLTISEKNVLLFQDLRDFLKKLKPNDGITNDFLIDSLIKQSPYYSDMVEYKKRERELIDRINKEYNEKDKSIKVK